MSLSRLPQRSGGPWGAMATVPDGGLGLKPGVSFVPAATSHTVAGCAARPLSSPLLAMRVPARHGQTGAKLIGLGPVLDSEQHVPLA